MAPAEDPGPCPGKNAKKTASADVAEKYWRVLPGTMRMRWGSICRLGKVMSQLRIRLWWFFKDIFTSGTFDKYEDNIEIYLKFVLINTIGIVAGVCLLGFGI